MLYPKQTTYNPFVGERSEDKVFFKAKDVARVFDMKHLNKVTYLIKKEVTPHLFRRQLS
jgi:hypothetical protein